LVLVSRGSWPTGRPRWLSKRAVGAFLSVSRRFDADAGRLGLFVSLLEVGPPSGERTKSIGPVSRFVGYGSRVYWACGCLFFFHVSGFSALYGHLLKGGLGVFWRVFFDFPDGFF